MRIDDKPTESDYRPDSQTTLTSWPLLVIIPNKFISLTIHMYELTVNVIGLEGYVVHKYEKCRRKGDRLWYNRKVYKN